MSDLLSEIYYTEKPKHEDVPLKRKFQPWHKPRKQYIRKFQWKFEVGRLIKDIKTVLEHDHRPLRYLSLPGQDMLDVRIISALCGQNNFNMHILGFDARSIEADISWHEISGRISSESLLLRSDIAKLANKDSLEYQNMKKIGPFDIINIDLCDSTASPTQSVQYHTAFKNLVEFQINKAVEPWLFFITTRGDSGSVCQAVIDQYMQNVIRNWQDSEKFRKILEDNGIGFNISRHEFIFSNDIVKAKFYAICFGKWILGLFNGLHNSWEISMLPSYGYKVFKNNNAPDMFSLAYRFKPVEHLLIDPVGLAAVEDKKEESESAAEVVQAVDIATKSFDLVDIDELLSANQEIFTAMVEESATLMKSARYDPDEYREWVNEGYRKYT